MLWFNQHRLNIYLILHHRDYDQDTARCWVEAMKIVLLLQNKCRDVILLFCFLAIISYFLPYRFSIEPSYGSIRNIPSMNMIILLITDHRIEMFSYLLSTYTMRDLYWEDLLAPLDTDTREKLNTFLQYIMSEMAWDALFCYISCIVYLGHNLLDKEISKLNILWLI